MDAENEKTIHDNLQSFFKGKTVLIIAHRLSTVKKADQIIVLKNGQIVEQGNHQQLTANKGEYYNLVKNQLELGSWINCLDFVIMASWFINQYKIRAKSF